MISPTSSLERLYSYFSLLSQNRLERGGKRVLYSPDSPLLASNAAYGFSSEADAFLIGKYAPRLFWNETPLEGAMLLYTLRIGTFWPPQRIRPLPFVVEQVAWNQSKTLCSILARAWLDESYTELLTRAITPALERSPSSKSDFQLLLAYPDHQNNPVAAALLLDNQIHLWGVLPQYTFPDNSAQDSRPLEAILEYAHFELNRMGNSLEISVPDFYAFPLLRETSRVGLYRLE